MIDEQRFLEALQAIAQSLRNAADEIERAAIVSSGASKKPMQFSVDVTGIYGVARFMEGAAKARDATMQKFYGPEVIDANRGRWLSVDQDGDMYSSRFRPELRDGEDVWFRPLHESSSFDYEWHVRYSEGGLLKNNGVRLHWTDTAYQVPLREVDV